MHIQIKRILLTVVFICLSLNATEVLACMCGNLSANDAVKKSAAVFSGKVVGFEYRKGIPNEYMDSLERKTGEKVDYETKVVKIQVEQWWKGNISREVFLITGSVRIARSVSFAGCDFNFKEGEIYLIYALGNNDELKTNACMRTRKLAQAEEDLNTLGEGKAPIEEKVEPINSMDARLWSRTFLNQRISLRASFQPLQLPHKFG